MPKVVNLSQTANSAKVVDLSRPAPTRGEKIIRTLGLVGLVAGTIAAGASAAHSHAKSNGGAK